MKKIDGAFSGKYEGPEGFPDGGKVCVNNRTTAYALNALIKIESDIKNIWLGRHNKKFYDPLKDCVRSGKFHDLQW